jgi:hypothetical protein
VRLRSRLQRLEREAATSVRAEEDQLDPWEDTELRSAYLRGEGPRPPDPPCPRWFDPAEWASRMRIGRCIEYRCAGELRGDEYLPDMNLEEREYVDGLVGAFDEFVKDREAYLLRTGPATETRGVRT